MQYKQVKYNRCVNLPDPGGGVLDCESRFTILSPPFDRPHYLTGPVISVCSSLYLLTRAHGALCSPSMPLWLALHLLEEEHNHPIVRFAFLCHMIGEELFLFFKFLYINLKRFELGVEVAFNNGSAVTRPKVNLLKFPLRSGSFERTDDAFVLLICFCFFHL